MVQREWHTTSIFFNQKWSRPAGSCRPPVSMTSFSEALGLAVPPELMKRGTMGKRAFAMTDQLCHVSFVS